MIYSLPCSKKAAGLFYPLTLGPCGLWVGAESFPAPPKKLGWEPGGEGVPRV